MSGARARTARAAPGAGPAKTLALALAVAVGACALPAPRIALGPVAPVPVPGDVDPDAPPLFLAPFSDTRDAASRDDHWPRFRPVRFGFGRRGLIQSGDRAFSTGVAEGARLDAAAALKRTGLFARVAPLERAVAGEARWVLEATVEELAGYQYVARELNLLAVGFFRNDHSEPFGVARVSYRFLHDDELRFSERVETRYEREGATPAHAARDALAITNERLAALLHARLRPDAAARARRLPVQVLDACGLGEVKVRRLVADANEVLVREAGIVLVPRVRVWAPPREPATPDELLFEVGRAERKDAELNLALAAMPRPAGRPFSSARFGLARPFGRDALVGCAPGQVASPLTVVHEIAHLFGAVHVGDPRSIMNPVAAFPARFLDPLNREVVRATADRPLGRGLPRATAERVLGLYRAALERGAVEADALAGAAAALDPGR